MSNYVIAHQNELNHYGVKGMKWGVRKQVHLSSGNRTRQPLSNQDIYQRKIQRRAKAKKIAKVGGAIALAALASYGAYKLSKNPQALQKGKDFLNYKILKKSKPFTPDELKKMGISTSEMVVTPIKEIPVKQIPVKEIPIKQTPISNKTTSTPVKDVPKQLKKSYGNLDPVKDDYYDFMDKVLKGIN